MKTLGTVQFEQIKYDMLPLDGSPFRGIIGEVTRNFIAVIYGFSGNGKTEFCLHLAKELAQHGKVAWMSYEQRFGSDLQRAVKRNNMSDVSGKFILVDPLAKVEANASFLEDLDNYLKKRSAAEFIFIDSLDYTGFGWSDYQFLKDKYGEKKTFIFISHSTKTGRLKKAISEQIIFDGGMGIFVSKYIATPEKNRFGGFDSYVIWEEKARQLNPLFFDKQLKENG